ncbi:hypothetical protein [Amycolatopsis sp. NPDC004079]|uniref:hypothetical protein n=1 Tax=Amycolatopsis sp. NPDC004079 TaxID=3154549 RepID=UPI0033BB7444
MRQLIRFGSVVMVAACPAFTAGPAGAEAAGMHDDAAVTSAVEKAVASAGQEPAVPSSGRVALRDGMVTVAGQAAGSVRMTLPGGTDKKAVSLSAGRSVTRDAGRGYAVAAESVRDGARGLVVLKDASAPERFDFTFDLPKGVSLSPRAGGRVAIVMKKGAGTLELGDIAAPWARDATGTALPTRYEVSGSTVTQIVDHRGARYPVVADPKLTYGRGVYLNLWGWEGNAIGAALGALIGAGGFVGCNVANVTGIAGTVVKIICNAGASKNAVGILKNLGARNLVPKWCYQNLILPTSGGWRPVDASNCR